MPICLEKLSNEPIVVVKLQGYLDLQSDGPGFAATLRATLDDSPNPLFVIADASASEPSLSSLAGGLAAIARVELTILRHPNVAGYCVVSGGEQPPISVYRTLDEALDVARRSVSQTA